MASVADTELAVDNRAVVEALAAQCERLGVRWASTGPVTSTWTSPMPTPW